MGFCDHNYPGSLYQLKSVSLRTNEDFVSLYNRGTKEALRLRVLDVVPDAREANFRSPYRPFLGANFWNGALERFQDKIRNADELMKRAENAELSKLLAGIALQLVERIKEFILPLMSLSFRDDMKVRVDPEILLKDLLEGFAECVSSGLESAHKLIVVSALALLSFMYQYLIGCLGKRGSKTYSPGSFLFRLIFVAIVLFLGSYVWIKSRQVSFTANRRKRKLGDESDLPVGVTRRVVKGIYNKYVPFLKPHREGGLSQQLDCLPLGSYDTPSEARIVYHIAAVLYGREKGGPVQFEDGFCLPFPSVTELEECPPSGKEKADWVTRKTKKLYAELLERKAGQLQLLYPALETASHHHGHAGETSRRDPSPSAPGACSTAIESTCFTTPHEGYGVVEQATTSESHCLGQEPLLARDLFSAFVLDCNVDQVISNLPQCEENNLPAMHDPNEFLVDYSETDHVSGFESTAVPPQSSVLDKPPSTIVASTQLGGGDQGLGVIEPHLNLATAITFQQLEAFLSDSDPVSSLNPQLDEVVRHYFETDRVFGFESTSVPPQSSALDKPPSSIVASPPQLGGGDQGLGVIEPHLNLATAITFQQLESLPEQAQLQQRVTCQEHRPEEFSESNVELPQKLLECEGRNAKLQQELRKVEKEKLEVEQKLRKSEVENEKYRQLYRSMFGQLAKLVFVSDEDGSPVDIQ